ncbi:MAG TPA: prolipoprotein diacylglyceryl transferase [Thermomicrobiales bacterium]|nr:prolipoprotein diacylglyceryl transferase [Thermomicrobiales bacterium]
MPSPADPVAFTLVGIAIRWYAIFILTGIVVAVIVARALAIRRGLDPDFALDAAPWLVFAGIIGARLYYVLLRFDYFVAHPAEAFNFRLGGMTIHGALAGGSLMFLYLCRRRRQPPLAWADVVMPGVAIAQAIGRWGNWANQEAFGTPTNLPWGVAIDVAHRPQQFIAATHFHPTFLYESLFDLVNGVVLAWLALRIPNNPRLRSGDVLWCYLVLYGVARFVIERMRTDSLYIGPFPAALWISAGLVCAGVVGAIASRALSSRNVAPASSPELPARPDAADA